MPPHHPLAGRKSVVFPKAEHGESTARMRDTRHYSQAFRRANTTSTLEEGQHMERPWCESVRSHSKQAVQWAMNRHSFDTLRYLSRFLFPRTNVFFKFRASSPSHLHRKIFLIFIFVSSPDLTHSPPLKSNHPMYTAHSLTHGVITGTWLKHASPYTTRILATC